MKLAALLLVTLATTAHAGRNDIVYGVIQGAGFEMELYRMQGSCKPGWREMSLHPAGDHTKHADGCWAIDVNDNVAVKLVDGTMEWIARNRIIYSEEVKPGAMK
jgi:hypothetical protein